MRDYKGIPLNKSAIFYILCERYPSKLTPKQMGCKQKVKKKLHKFSHVPLKLCDWHNWVYFMREKEREKNVASRVSFSLCKINCTASAAAVFQNGQHYDVL